MFIVFYVWDVYAISESERVVEILGSEPPWLFPPHNFLYAPPYIYVDGVRYYWPH